MNRRDIQELRIHCGFPAITLVMPCQERKVREALKSLVDQAQNSEWADAVMARTTELLSQLSCPVKPFKTAIFIDKYRAKAFVVPADVPDCAVCDTTFCLDEIVKALNRQHRYLVIDCTNKAPKLLEGFGEHILEVQNACVIMDDGPAIDLFDRCIANFLEQDRLPICVVGPAQATQHFEFLAPYADFIIAHVADRSEAWPAIERWQASKVEHVMKKVGDGRPDVDFLSDVHAIIDQARQGLVRFMAIEEGYVREGCEHPVTRAILLNSECPTGYVTVPLIDEITESVRSKGGMVLLMPSGTLGNYGHMVAFTDFL